MFEWHKRERLNEQLKFFGGEQKRFISCYAKQIKPRIRIKVKELPRENQLLGRHAAMNALARDQGLALLNLQTGANLAAQQAGAAANLYARGTVGMSGGIGCGVGLFI